MIFLFLWKQGHGFEVVHFFPFFPPFFGSILKNKKTEARSFPLLRPKSIQREGQGNPTFLLRTKNIYFKLMRNFAQNWFHIDTKMMQNCVQKNSFVKKPETVSHKNLLFRRNPREGKHPIALPPSFSYHCKD